MIKSLKFSHKIPLVASLVVSAVFALFTLYDGYLQRSAIREDLESYLQEMGDVTSSNIQNWLGGRLLLVEQTAQTPACDYSPEAVSALLEQPALTSTFSFTYLGQQDGVFTTRPGNSMPAGYDPRSRPWYKDAVAAGGLTLTEPYVDAVTQEPIITAATPVKAAGNTLGAVGSDLSLKALVRIINSLDFSGIGYVFLVSGDGKILAHPDKEQVMKTLSEVYPQSTSKIVTGFSEAELHGHTRILTFTLIKGLPSVIWYLVPSIDKDKAYAMPSKFRVSAIVVALISTVAILVLLGLLICLLIQLLYLMGCVMQDIAQDEGDLIKRLAVTSRDEFGMFDDALNQFVEWIHRSIREIIGTARKLHDVSRLVVNASSSSMTNSDEQSNHINSAAAAINKLGAAVQEIVRNVTDASHHASDTNHQAEDGRQVVGQTIRAMNESSEKINASYANIEALNSRTVNTDQTLETIKGISEQTNLLVLNAATEAARVDEVGRGFMVVTDEVRNLAHCAQELMLQIQKMIEELQVGVHEMVATMTENQRYSLESVEIANHVGESLGSMTRRIGKIDGANQSVATATEGQTAMIDSPNIDITETNTLNQGGVENLQATLYTCGELETQAGCLRQLVNSFKI